SDGDQITDSPYKPNKGAFLIHSALHKARPDVNCIIHWHGNASVAVGAQREGLLPLSQEAMLLLPDLAYHDFERVVLDAAEQVRLAANLGRKNVMLLRNHGSLAMGSSIGSAFVRAYFLEKVCQVQLGAQAGSSLYLPPADVMDKVGQQAVAIEFGTRAD